MKKFTFEFTEEQINYIINVLAQRPYVECNGLLNEINRQASVQLNSQPEQTLEVVEE